MHVGYETCEPFALQETAKLLDIDPKKDCRVIKMTFGKAKDKKIDKSIVFVNSNITIGGIPLEAYDYIVNGRPAIEWVMERYQVSGDKDSKITNDPNDWSDDPRYIVDLLKRVVRVSIDTMKIVKSLPALDEYVTDSSAGAMPLTGQKLTTLPAAAAEAFFERLPSWVKIQSRSKVFRFTATMTLRDDENFLSEISRTKPSAIILSADAFQEELNESKAYSVIAQYPSGATRTVGEFSENIFSPFGYWALIDPEQEPNSISTSEKIEVDFGFVIVEVKND